MKRPSYSHGTSDLPLLGETIGQNLERTASAYPDREALVDAPSGRRWTYRRFDEEVGLLARGLIAAGIEKGDRVGIWSPNNPEWVLLQYATAKIGAILVTVSPYYRTHQASTASYVLRQSGVKLLVSAIDHKTGDYRAMIEKMRPGLPDLERVIYIGSGEWDALFEAGAALDPGRLEERMASLSPDDPINIQYTFGTIAYPKGATLSHHNILNNGFFIGELCRYTEIDRVCVPVSFYHCFGMVLGNLAITTHGACIVIPAPDFDAAATLKTVQAERCTSLYGGSIMFGMELDLPEFSEYDLTSLRTGIITASKRDAELVKQVIAQMHMPELTNCYGMTEAPTVSTQTRVDDELERRVSTVGQAHPHVEIKIIDPATGLTVPRGTVGELCFRGYSVMLGYWNDPERTAEMIDAARWMHTGDLATMDDEGYVDFLARSTKEMVMGR